MLIREIRPDEFDVVGDLVVEAYRQLEAPSVTQAHLDYFEEMHDTAMRAAACTVLVAVDDAGEVLGSVSYVPGPESAYAELERDGEAGFRMLGVRPTAQGRGVGRRLVEACIERARADGRARLVLSTSPVMHAARHLYETLGFRRAPQRDWSPAPGIDLLAYVLDLREGGLELRQRDRQVGATEAEAEVRIAEAEGR